MTGAVREDIDGLPLDEATETVVERVDAPDDPATVRATLDRITEDGVVRAGAVEDALAAVSKAVSTPETRLELADLALSEARETAAHVADLDAVGARLDTLEERLETIERRVETLHADLEALVEESDDPDDLYAVARGLERLFGDATDAQATADDLQLDAEALEHWVESPDARYDEFAADLDALADALDDIAGVVDTLASAGDRALADPAATWADASLRHRSLALLLADLRAELGDFRRWAEREELEEGRLDELHARLDDLADRRESVGDDLDAVARPDWEERFAAAFDGLEADLAASEPPVDWGAVSKTLDRYRPRNGG
jgi:chromosome segregation ATPase